MMRNEETVSAQPAPMADPPASDGKIFGPPREATATSRKREPKRPAGGDRASNKKPRGRTPTSTPGLPWGSVFNKYLLPHTIAQEPRTSVPAAYQRGGRRRSPSCAKTFLRRKKFWDGVATGRDTSEAPNFVISGPTPPFERPQESFLRRNRGRSVTPRATRGAETNKPP